MSEVKKAFFGIASNYINIFINVIYGLIVSGLAVRVLSDAFAGILLLFIGFNGMLALCDFGISQTLSREISLVEGIAGKKIRKKILFSAAKNLNFRLSILGFVVIAPLLFLYFMRIASSVNQIELEVSVSLFLLSALLRLLANPYLAAIYGSKNVGQERALRSIAILAGLSFLLIALCFNKTLIIFTFGFFVQNITLLFLSLWKVPIKERVYAKIKKHRRYLFSKSIQLFAIYFGSCLIFQVTGPIVAHYLSATAMVSFMPPFQITSTLMTLAMLAQSSIFPFVSSIFTKKGVGALQQSSLMFLKFNVFFLVCALFFINIFGDSIFAIWLGPHYHLNHLLLMLLSIMVILQIQQDTLASMVMSCGYIKFGLAPVWIGGALNILFLIFFLPRYGIVGAGWAVFLGQLLTGNWYIVLVSLNFLKISLYRFLLKYGLSMILSCLLVLFFLKLSRAYLMINSVLSLTLLGCVFAIFSFALFWYILLMPDERVTIRALLLKRLSL